MEPGPSGPGATSGEAPATLAVVEIALSTGAGAGITATVEGADCGTRGAVPLVCGSGAGTGAGTGAGAGFGAGCGCGVGVGPGGAGVSMGAGPGVSPPPGGVTMGAGGVGFAGVAFGPVRPLARGKAMGGSKIPNKSSAQDAHAGSMAVTRAGMEICGVQRLVMVRLNSVLKPQSGVQRHFLRGRYQTLTMRSLPVGSSWSDSTYGLSKSAKLIAV